MVYRLWRQAHMWLAAVSFVFLLIVALTGTILGIHAVGVQASVQVPPSSWSELHVADLLHQLRERYTELTTLSVAKSGEVTLRGFDEAGEEFHVVLDPTTGATVGVPHEDSPFIVWITSLHRSLFLHEMGRIVVGVATFLCLLILLSGIVLVAKRQGLRHLFGPIERTSGASYWHTALGRWLVIPLIVSAGTGTYLFMERMGLFPTATSIPIEYSIEADTIRPATDFPIFRTTRLAEVASIDFPLLEDEEEFYTLHLRDRSLTINQFTGAIIAEERYPWTALASELSLDLHTGRTSIWWALALAIGSLSMIVFIATGGWMIYRRKRTTHRGESVGDAQIALLVGSEQGSTMRLAQSVAAQWQAQGIRVALYMLNDYTSLGSATHLVVFTSTYGDGIAPSNATRFVELLAQTPQEHEMQFSVVAFGSHKFPRYCAYGYEVDALLGHQPWAKRLLPIHTVNMRSETELAEWAKQWSASTPYPLSSDPTAYTPQRKTTG